MRDLPIPLKFLPDSPAHWPRAVVGDPDHCGAMAGLVVSLSLKMPMPVQSEIGRESKTASSHSRYESAESHRANSPAQLQARIAEGRLSWLVPLLLVTGRTALILLAQGLVATILLLRGRTHPWLAAAPWWTVYGTLVDIGCLILMWKFTRKEGIRLRDLIGPIRLRYGRDFFFAIGILAVMFPLFVSGAAISTWIFGAYQPFPGLTDARVLPRWATIYSFSVWWMIWSPTEEMTYAGYALPRIQALGGTWVAVVVVGFWWTIQHPFLPFLLDWHNFLWRFTSFLPAIVALTLIYLRLRRLAPLILAHWTMDIVAVLMTLHR